MIGGKELGKSIVGKFVIISFLVTLLGRYILFKIALNTFGEEMGDDRKIAKFPCQWIPTQLGQKRGRQPI